MFTKIKEFAFKGLQPSYYFRNIFFGLFFCAIMIALAFSPGIQIEKSVGFIVLSLVSLVLYPYSRFVFATIFSFIMGNNVFFVNATFLILSKLFTMLICFFLAVVIAPIGLIMLYIINSRAYNKYQQEMKMQEQNSNTNNQN